MNDDLEASQIFIAEAQDLQASIERNLLDLSEAPENRDLIDALFRELHTLKGSAAMFGFAPLSNFVHEFETAFETLRTPDGKASEALITVALAACDHFEPLLTDPDNAVAESEPILDRLRAALGDEGADAASDDGPEDGFQDDGYDDEDDYDDDGCDDGDVGGAGDAPTGAGQWHLSFSLGEEALSLGINPIGLLEELRELGGAETTVRVDLSQIEPLKDADPQHPRLIWHVTLPAHVAQAGLDDVFMFVMDDLDLTMTPPGEAPSARAGDETAEPIEAVGEPAAQEAAEKPAAKAETPAKADEIEKPKPAAAPSSMRVTTERLDELMDRVGELVIAEARLHELSAVLGDGALLSVAEDIRRLTSGMRDTTMTIRMVPIGSLFGRFRRLVHDLSGQLGKPMDLVTIGGETELDKTVIETLADPLVHIIRNSVDHGIEKPELRAENGKEETGRIEISANQEGAEVVIQIRDDGAGLDLERISARAIERGLMGEGDTVSDADMRMMIFEPGFSTAPEITALSGRGVGMDVVRTTMEALRGRIEVDSTLGAGTTVTMRLPLTLAIIDGLLVQIGEERYTLPLAAIEECVELPSELIENDGQSNFLSVRDGLVPFLRLSELFNVPGPRSPFQKVVIVGSSLGRVGLVVDHIVTTNQTVIKQLSRLHAGLKSFSGATILGDGSVALILDVSNLIAEGRRLEERGRSAERVA